jgi:hypothetical protein
MWSKEGKEMPTSKYPVDQPATYRIRVYGTLDARWSGRLGDMRIAHPDDPAGQTVLTGELTDQAALLGVLNSLYSLHLFLLNVEHIELKVVDRGDNSGAGVPPRAYGR